MRARANVLAAATAPEGLHSHSVTIDGFYERAQRAQERGHHPYGTSYCAMGLSGSIGRAECSATS